jgi:ribosomal protein L7/L12
METPNPSDQLDLVRKALLAGNKIEAIKLYREQTGAGLAEAKTAVEAMEGGVREVSGKNESDRTNPTADVRQALLAGKKIEAIKIYRQQMRVGLAEAKAAVDAMEGELRRASPEVFGSSQRTGCFGVLMGCVFAGLALWKVLR